VTYSEDYPAFAGDQTGQLLAEPDVVALSPVTSARVVETQSGYLVVLKKADERISLSVKRRIGTPPSSQVLLTSEESIQLSRVLADSAETIGAVRGDFFVREVAEPTPPSAESLSPSQAALSTIYGEQPGDEAQLDWDEIKQPWRKRKSRQDLNQIASPAPEALEADSQPRKIPVKPVLLIAGGVGAIVAVVAVIIGITTAFSAQQTADAKKAAAVAAISKESVAPMSADKVDKFVRNFVTDMLDFNPKTYRASQVHAMAVMKPELLERYWQETGFPLSKQQLRNASKDQTLIINKVVQQPTSNTSSDVELSADLLTPGSEESTPVRLLISLGVDLENQIIVTEMKDSSPKETE